MHTEYNSCTLCPRKCKADRNAQKRGFCGAGALPRVARAALHFWEEPCISGVNGSGTVFFSHCTLGCLFCQNHEISHLGSGVEITEERLCDIFLELQEKGEKTSFEQVLSDLRQRDKQDSTRAIAPLRCAHDAVTLDTSEQTVEESVAAMLAIIREKLG